MNINISLVVPTVGRSDVLIVLLESLSSQTKQADEIIVVDQNLDDRLVDIVSRSRDRLPIVHLRTNGAKGASYARNLGLKSARNEIIGFPDDDCWYPSNYLEYGASQLEKHGLAALSGRAVNSRGAGINAKYKSTRVAVTRSNVWTAGIEWVAMFKRTALLDVGGYDERIGVGSGTPWGANEHQDVLLRLIEHGYHCVFDPSLSGYHAEISGSGADRGKQARALSYGRGAGYVLGLHGFGAFSAAYRTARPLASALIAISSGDSGGARFHVNVARGRLSGWRDGIAERARAR